MAASASALRDPPAAPGLRTAHPFRGLRRQSPRLRLRRDRAALERRVQDLEKHGERVLSPAVYQGERQRAP